ncbi:MAG: hypothetical protein CFE24_07595 [Flavobacterium sp. BFFFF2]|nr:MAG: hypothetical protein CFE24_07595 [Flavobacterium sp. BFFFF2]
MKILFEICLQVTNSLRRIFVHKNQSNLYMKNIVFGVAIALLLTSCNNKAYTINGTGKKMKDGTEIIIEKSLPKATNPTAIDTAKVTKGNFVSEGEIDEPTLAFVSVKGKQAKFPFILEHGDIQIEVDQDSIFKSKVSGTFNNDEFQLYFSENVRIQRKIMAFQQQHMAEIMMAQQNRDMGAMMKLMGQMEPLQKELSTFMEKFVKEHTKAFTSLLILENMLMSQQKTAKELQKMLSHLDADLLKTKRAEAFTKTLKDALKPQQPTSAAPTSEASQKAPDFTAKTPDGKELSLYSLQGKVILVDFWASWCGPCRRESPEMVQLYKDFKDKGLTIIGVSLDKEAAAWKKAIASDHLDWNQVSNLKEFQDPIAVLYKVEQIPTNFLLNDKKEIIAKDLHGADLRKKMAELLN